MPHLLSLQGYGGYSGYHGYHCSYAKKNIHLRPNLVFMFMWYALSAVSSGYGGYSGYCGYHGYIG